MKAAYRIATVEQAQALGQRLARAVLNGDKSYEVTVQPWSNKRSIEQNSLMWVYLTTISQQMPPHMDGVWHSPEVWKLYFQRRFLPMKPGPFGEGVPTGTSELKVGPFADFLTEIEAWAAEHEIELGEVTA